jgi:hypothetical protein
VPPPAPQRAAAASTTPDLRAPSTRSPHPDRIHTSLPRVGAAAASAPVPLAGVHERAPTLARLDSAPPCAFVCASSGAPSLGRVASPCSRRPRSAPPLARPLQARRSHPLWPLDRGHVASPCYRPPRSAAAQHRLRRDLRGVLPPSGLVQPTPCVGIFAQQRLFTPLPSPSSTRPARSGAAPYPAGPAPPRTLSSPS